MPSPAPSGSSTALRHGAFDAHGKAILLGEHAVVHGAPAIALPVAGLAVHVDADETAGPSLLDSALYRGPLEAAPAQLQPTVTAARAVLERFGASELTLRLRVRSAVPVERGLGSSAAVAAATVGAVARMLGLELDADLHHELVQEAERVAHGTPSGLDARAVLADAPIWFHGGRIEPVAVGASFAFVLADTGAQSGTREAVAAVHAQRATDPARVARAVEELGDLAVQARDDLGRGDHDALGTRLDDAHALLQQLDVSSPGLDHLVRAARDAGARGAKLTGGGRGGCILALAADAAVSHHLAEALRRAGAAAAWTTTVERTS
ncbi:mevalonate kinase [Microbacterium sp.]|uniref:mevalonate kinase n=1 Tax=Microbacterium sp. TaxID=51671 RepID=UPI0039E58096